MLVVETIVRSAGGCRNWGHGGRAALAVALFASLMVTARAVQSKQNPTGEQIFRGRCASCHGARGEGTVLHKKRLNGDKSVGQLGAFIRQNMPPGARQKLSVSEAQSAAAYIYDSFYSPLAQERNRPARVALSRLTVRQFRNVVADLVGSFRPAVRWDDKRGLHGEYFKTGQIRRGEKLLERVDPELRFDFGTAGALPQQDDPYQFAIRWEGSVIAPDTGEYEFILRTEHAARLWINDLRAPLIDGYVRSGDSNEYHAPLNLLGGRAYPLRLEFSKGVVGVNDLKKVKEKPPTRATITLEWRPPKRSVEVIPERCLIPTLLPESYVSVTPFPPDDRSIGYERGTSISKAWDEATTEATLETAGYIAGHVDELVGLRTTDRRGGDSPSGNPSDIKLDGQGESGPAAERAAKIRALCRQFVERAFRRPLSADLEKYYIARQFSAAADLETAVKRVVILSLKSPRFLYREMASGKPDAYDVASRLSFGIWDSLPDQELLRAAAAGQLSTREQVMRQAERMEADPRAWFKLRDFLLQWLKVDSYPDLAKDPKKYPGFEQSIHSDLRTSFELFLENVAWGSKSDFRELWLTDKLFLNGRLATIYGVNLPRDAPFQLVSLDPSERAGVLTHPYLMASFAYLDSSSPIHRGVLIARNLLGRALRPPPQAFTPSPASLRPNMTTRQRVAMQTQPQACQGCHSMINPLGFTLEKFDAIGRLRTEENGKAIDATGSYETADGKIVKFSGVRDLAQYLAGGDEAHAAFVQKLFQYMVKQPIRAYGPKALSDLERTFESNELSVRRLIVEIMAGSALKG